MSKMMTEMQFVKFCGHFKDDKNLMSKSTHCYKELYHINFSYMDIFSYIYEIKNNHQI